MNWPTYFLQQCPACGRSLQVRVMYLGRPVICQHCERPFIAQDPANANADGAEVADGLLQRADALLESLELRKRAV